MATKFSACVDTHEWACRRCSAMRLCLWARISIQWQQTAHLLLAVHIEKVSPCAKGRQNPKASFWWKMYYFYMQENLTNLMQIRRSKHSSTISSMVWKGSACYSSLPVPHFSIPSSRDLCDRSTASSDAPYLFSWTAFPCPWTTGLYTLLFCHWQEKMKICQKYILWSVVFLSFFTKAD